MFGKGDGAAASVRMTLSGAVHRPASGIASTAPIASHHTPSRVAAFNVRDARTVAATMRVKIEPWKSQFSKSVIVLFALLDEKFKPFCFRGAEMLVLEEVRDQQARRAVEESLHEV